MGNKPRPMFLVWLLILGAVLAAFFMMDPARTQSEDVSISEFINRVEAGEVTNATFTGDRVRGTTARGTITAYSTDRTELTRVLREKHVPYREEPPSQTGNMLMMLLKLAIPILILVFFFRMMKNAGGGGGMIKQVMSSKATLHTEGKVTFNDVAGCDEAKEECKDLVDFLKDPAKFMKLGGRVPKGVLMIGPTGTGKTLLARAIAGEAGVPFFSADASSFVEMFVGVGAARVRDLFENARKKKPCIIFIDEIDAVGKSRGGITSGSGGHDEREQTLNQLLIEMDGFSGNDGIIVIAATNRPEVLDRALLRPGRFNRHVVVPKPDIKGRIEILKVHSRGKPLGADVDLSIIARGTPGMTGADLENLLNEAALRASKLNKAAIGMDDIEYARYKVLMGPERKGVVLTDEEKKVIAYHESGHTLVGWFTPGCDPVNHVTIISRGQALGLTWSLPLQDRKLSKRSELLAEVKMLYGGRVAEELILGDDFTTGASNDLMRLTDIAKRMVTDFGMSESLGQRTFGEKTGGWFEQSQNDFSDETAAAIDREIKSLTAKCYDAVKQLLTEKRELLDRLAAELMAKESLGAPEIEAILGPRPVTA